ncbi:MAG: hypothetical protein ACW99F_04035 [Candidatus Hodarchaeales archaeon]|jgi:hypothetical protein
MNYSILSEFAFFQTILQETNIDLHVAEFFYVALFVLFLLPFLTIYFIPKSNIPFLTKRSLIQLLIMDIVFCSGFLLIELVANPTFLSNPILKPGTSEYFIVTFIWMIVYITAFYPFFLSLLRQSIVYNSKADYKATKKAIQESANKLRGRRIMFNEDLPNFFQYRIPGAYFLTYNLDILIGDTDEETKQTRVIFTFKHSIRNINIIRVLVFSLFGIVVLARSEWILTPVFMGTTIDSQIFFTLGVFAFIFFNILIASACENLVFQREDLHRKALVNLKQMSFSKPDLEEIRNRARAKLGIVDEKPDLEEIKRRAREKLDLSVERAEKEKEERIDKLLDRAEDKFTPQIKPEIIRMESLIREVKKILNATPEANSIQLSDIVKMLGGSKKTKSDELEQIIIGLVNKREVRGEYDIWTKSYIGSNIRNQFINRTLKNLEIKKEEITSLSISGDTMEIVFKDNIANSDIKKQGKKKLDKKSD